MRPTWSAVNLLWSNWRTLSRRALPMTAVGRTEFSENKPNGRSAFVPTPDVRFADRIRQHAEDVMAGILFTAFFKQNRLQQHEHKRAPGSLRSSLLKMKSADEGFLVQETEIWGRICGHTETSAMLRQD